MLRVCMVLGACSEYVVFELPLLCVYYVGMLPTVLAHRAPSRCYIPSKLKNRRYPLPRALDLSCWHCWFCGCATA